MITRALVIGVDGYANVPLTTAVNDAEAFCDVLVTQQLVDPDNITMLLSTADGARNEAQYDRIKEELLELYVNGGDVDRFIFYFAGHGLVAYSDAQHLDAYTALMPVDGENFRVDASRLLNLRDLQRYFRRAGPKEQFFFVDACRDLPYEQHPGQSTLGWAKPTSQVERAQRTLFAVAELGKALGIPDANGLMTRRLVEALEGATAAITFNERTSNFVLTMESVRDYVRTRIEKDLGSAVEPFALPQLDGGDPAPRPLRVIADPPRCPLRVRIDPPDAEVRTKVEVTLGSHHAANWPPHGKIFELDPRHYSLKATATRGRTDPSQCVVDVREQSEVVVTVHDDAPPRREASVAPEPRIATVTEDRSPYLVGVLAHAHTPEGTIVARAGDDTVAIDMRGLEPPHQTHSALGTLKVDVAPGPYRVGFRLGPDVLSSREIFVGDGDTVEVNVRLTPGVRRNVLDWNASPVQLLRLGLAPFMGARAPLRLAEAASGFRERARSLEFPVAVTMALGEDSPHPGPVRTLRGPEVHPEVVETPYGRAGVALLEGRPGAFELVLHDRRGRKLRIGSVALPNRVTVLTLRRAARGRLDLTYGLLPHPSDRESELPPPQELAELLQTSQQLYKSRELREARQSDDISRLLFAKWTDPLFAVLAIYGVKDPSGGDTFALPFNQASFNLLNSFGDLPDAWVAASLVRREERGELLEPLLAAGDQPLLARSVAELAAYARETGRAEHPVVERSARVLTGQPWNVTLA